MAVAAPPAPVARSGYGTLRQLSRYQWFVFVVAAIAWMADCMDQQLFNLAARLPSPTCSPSPEPTPW